MSNKDPGEDLDAIDDRLVGPPRQGKRSVPTAISTPAKPWPTETVEHGLRRRTLRFASPRRPRQTHMHDRPVRQVFRWVGEGAVELLQRPLHSLARRHSRGGC